MTKKRPEFREGDRVSVQAVVGPNGELAFHEPLSTAKMVLPRVEVGDHLYSVSEYNEENIKAGGRVVAIHEGRAWIDGNGGNELVYIDKNSRVLVPTTHHHANHRGGETP